jgi:CDP-diglyceride synthetase
MLRGNAVGGTLRLQDKRVCLGQRFLSSVFMITITALAIINNILFIAVVVLLTAGGLYEFFYMVRKKDVPIYSYTGILIGHFDPYFYFYPF